MQTFAQTLKNDIGNCQNCFVKVTEPFLQESIRHGAARALVHAVQVEKGVYALRRSPTSVENGEGCLLVLVTGYATATNKLL